MSANAKPEAITLWALTLTWPCDYTQIERPRLTIFGSKEKPKPPIAISVHLDGCRRCMMQKNLLYFDEILERTAEANFEEFDDSTGAPPYQISVEQFEAISEHAQVVRDEMLGCPKT